jgi:hypothetical protein
VDYEQGLPENGTLKLVDFILSCIFYRVNPAELKNARFAVNTIFMVLRRATGGRTVPGIFLTRKSGIEL